MQPSIDHTPTTAPITSSAPLRGGCFCGSVCYALTAPPHLSAYCHCTICQRLTGCPFIHTLHFKASAFKWNHTPLNSSVLDTYDNPVKPWKTRWRCKTCGSTIATFNRKTCNWSVWGAQFERDASGKLLERDGLKPTAHIFYATRMLDVADGLSKWTGYEGHSDKIA